MQTWSLYKTTQVGEWKETKQTRKESLKSPTEKWLATEHLTLSLTLTLTPLPNPNPTFSKRQVPQLPPADIPPLSCIEYKKKKKSIIKMNKSVEQELSLSRS